MKTHPLHWAQAQCYAFMYAKEHKIKSVAVQIIYSQLDSRQTRAFEKSFTIPELKEFFERLALEYIAWAKVLKKWALTRDTSIKSLSFPFETYRAGQEELVETVWKTVNNGSMLFAQAPTGIGKTMATLYPAVKAAGEGVVSKIFYATAKTVTRAIAENALDTMRRKGSAA